MNVLRVMVNCFAVIVFALVSTVHAMQEGEMPTSAIQL